jgi:glycosyltransferase involved in cell wall biosynthesis
MTIGVKYIAYGNNSGYGLAALAYVRALHNAGIPVWWQPWFLGPQPVPWRPEQGLAALPLAHSAERDVEMSDVAALLRVTTRPIAYDTIIVHTVPEHWARFVEPGTRFVGYTVWETDALPAHWPELLGVADVILVPSNFNAELFTRGAVAHPVRVVPHIRRHAWSPSARDDAVALRLRLGIPDDHFVFYSIAAWDPRKAVAELVEAFACEFSAQDRVTLLLKTSAAINNAAAGTQSVMSIHERTRAIVDEACRSTGRAAANIAVIAVDDMSARTLDAIHAAGHAYASLTHGEGWGMGAFEAATLGKPVIVTGWGGHVDYLGGDYPGLLRYEMTRVGGWLPHASYQPAQRWASADRAHAARQLRAALGRDETLFGAAVRVREDIMNRFAEPVVAQRLLAAIDG